MSTVDRAFFAAYSHDDGPAVGPAPQVSPPPHRSSAASTATGRRTPPKAGVTTDSARYRVDAPHPEGASKPHHPVIDSSKPMSRPAPPVSYPTQAFEVGCFVADVNLLSSTIVLAPVQLPAEPPRAPAASSLPEAAPSLPEAAPSRPPAAASPAKSPMDAASRHEERSPSPPEDAVDSTRDAQESDPPALQTTASDGEWKPLWEIDEFVWPEEVTRLYSSQIEYFRHAGGKLRDASQEGLKVLAVVATREKEGCSTLAACLARGAAAAGARVALFDANLFNPELGPKLGLDFSRGWQDSLDNPGSLNESAVLSLSDNLTLFPLAVPHRVASLNDPRISRLIRESSRHFDLVIVDGGMTTPADDRLFEAGDVCPIDAAMIVRDVRRTTETETLVTASRLKSLGIAAIGIAENFTSTTDGSAQSAAA